MNPVDLIHGVISIIVSKCSYLQKRRKRHEYCVQRQVAYLVPNNLSPASPRPGKIYPFSFNCLSCVET